MLDPTRHAPGEGYTVLPDIVFGLSLEQQYDLLKIANETTDQEVKRAALDILIKALHPPVKVKITNVR